MQADNLRPQDCKKLIDLFKMEILPENPEARMITFARDKFKPKKDCLFKDKCNYKK